MLFRAKHSPFWRCLSKTSTAYLLQARTFLRTIERELPAVEKKPSLDVSDSQPGEQERTKACSDRLIALLHAMPNGVIRMSDDVKGGVETPLNFGVVSMETDKAEIRCLIRSLRHSLLRGLSEPDARNDHGRG